MLDVPQRITRKQALNIIRAFLYVRYSPLEIERWGVSLSKRPLRPHELSLRMGQIAPENMPDDSGSWVAFVDQNLNANFAHECLYLLVDPSGKVRSFSAEWYPVRLRTRSPDWGWINPFWVSRAAKNEVQHSLVCGRGLIRSTLNFSLSYLRGLWSIPQNVWELCTDQHRWGLYEKVNIAR